MKSSIMKDYRCNDQPLEVQAIPRYLLVTFQKFALTDFLIRCMVDSEAVKRCCTTSSAVKVILAPALFQDESQ